MDIAAMSISMNQMKLRQEVGLALTKKVLDSAQDQGLELLKMLDANTEILKSMDPNLGNIIDIRV